MEDFFDYFARALHGPGSFRFLVQPAAALLLGVRDGKRDAKEGRTPFLMDLLLHTGRWTLVKGALVSMGKLLGVCITLDAVVQMVLTGRSSLLQAAFVGGLLVGAPYAVSRGLTNRFSRHHAT